jgi:hypothetical protein
MHGATSTLLAIEPVPVDLGEMRERFRGLAFLRTTARRRAR